MQLIGFAVSKRNKKAWLEHRLFFCINSRIITSSSHSFDGLYDEQNIWNFVDVLVKTDCI